MKGKPDQARISVARRARTFRGQWAGRADGEDCRSSGVSNGTLFNYFPTKQDLIDTLYLDIELIGLFVSSGAEGRKSLRRPLF